MNEIFFFHGWMGYCNEKKFILKDLTLSVLISFGAFEENVNSDWVKQSNSLHTFPATISHIG